MPAAPCWALGGSRLPRGASGFGSESSGRFTARYEDVSTLARKQHLRGEKGGRRLHQSWFPVRSSLVGKELVLIDDVGLQLDVVPRNLHQFQAIFTLLVIISLTSVKVQGIFLDSSLANTVWYHDNLTRHAAEALLLSNGQDGSYLLRKSNEREDLYSLSVRGKDSVKHFHVEHTGTSFKFGFNEFSSLKELVMHFANQPLIGSETGTLIVLKHPYPREVEEPSIYESVRVHTAMQTGRTESDLVPNAPSLGTKEGYLIKQGKIVKNWKTRWFTLHRNELKYFKDQTATEPIRALDLTECSAVQFDYSQERVNCFCLVFPLRTYYLCAKTGIEADEWIKILRWKLSQIRKQLEQRNSTLSS
ncbi:PREDICTED: dual adapter for phosphotyrosine and 3-phosphotyrosine and 3-phosphoinositide [Charadrius vociferus]|nr:PREDICTED: dual adapter for phosphotyrosine and 3-phosphotyrosine and 3-phosphoinositide [Charadrius vociferus]